MVGEEDSLPEGRGELVACEDFPDKGRGREGSRKKCSDMVTPGWEGGGTV